MRRTGFLIFALGLLLAPRVWAEDPHLGVMPQSEDLDSAGDFDSEGVGGSEDMSFESETRKPADNKPLEIPSKPNKPEVPTLFAGASFLYKEWKAPAPAPEKPAAPAPAREVASTPDVVETKRLTDEAMSKLTGYEQKVKEASLVPDTYGKILRAMSSKTVTPQPIRDTRK